MNADVCKVIFVTNVPAPYKTSRLNALARQDGVELTVIYANHRTQRHEYESIPNHDFGVEQRQSIRVPFFSGEVMIDCWSLARFLQVEADVFIVGGWNYLAAWSALLASEIRDIPIGVISENTEQQTSFSRHLMKHALKRFDVCFATSESAAKHLERLGVDREDIVVLPYSIDVDRFRSELDVSIQKRLREQYDITGESVILYVGLLEERKGVDDLIQAVAAIDDIDPHLLIVGSGPAKQNLRQFADDRLEDRVTFAGYVPNKDLPNYYGLADIFVLPTLFDPWGLVLNEALATETPVVTTTAAGAAGELVRDRETGLLVPPGDSSALSDALREILTNDALRERLTSLGYDIVEEYRPEVYAEQMETRLRTLVAGE